MDTLYLFDVREQNGLFCLGRDEELIGRLSGFYNVIRTESERLGSLDDLAVSITDESPDSVLIRLSQNTDQLVCALLGCLARSGIRNVMLYSPEAGRTGTVTLDKTVYTVVGPESNLPYAADNSGRAACVLNGRISYGQNAWYVLRNGLDAFMTGAYPDRTQSHLKHLYFKETPECLPAFSNELFDVNSAMIFPDYKRGRFEDLKRPERGIFMHLHQRRRGGIQMDNGESCDNFDVYGYSEIGKHTKAYAEIATKADLTALLRDVDKYVDTGHIPYLGIRLVNECAWGIAPCTMPTLIRGWTDRSMKLRPCPGCSQSVGSVEDDCFDLARNTAVLLRTNRSERACGQCEMSSLCSKCALLPDGLTAEDYCSAIRHPGTIDYLFKTVVVGGIFVSSSQMKQIDPGALEISSPYRRLIATELNGLPKPCKRSILIALRTGGNYYMLGYKSSKIYQTDERLIWLAEMFDAELPMEEILTRYAQRFQIDAEQAGDHINEAHRMLKNEVML